MGAQRSRVAVIGAGAIGGVLAAAAHSAGHEVTLCVRTPFDHLVLETPEGTGEIPVTIATEPAAAAEADWVLLATKVQDVVSTEPWLRRSGAQAPIVVVQNGIEHRESLAPLGLHAPVLPALTYVGAERVRPGHIVRRSGVRVIVPQGELGARFAELFGDGHTAVSLSPDFHTEAWRKLLTNLAANPITALTLRRLDVFAEPGITRLAEGVLAEGLAVSQAEGARLTTADTDKIMAAYTGGWPGDNGTSMLYDRLAGLPSEHVYISGPLVRAGQRHNILTPLNDALLALMRAMRVG